MKAIDLLLQGENLSLVPPLTLSQPDPNPPTLLFHPRIVCCCCLKLTTIAVQRQIQGKNPAGVIKCDVPSQTDIPHAINCFFHVSAALIHLLSKGLQKCHV